ncbi:MAG TPA: ABC transporter substrate-binding protein [Candidatus Dormibacteraeota bacterium]|jgi:peptide/nickel transport system substrate-binding protein|nr:ABC transporter substrate-binding protein [Candidatus Dormibacteraeota bacterium]
MRPRARPVLVAGLALVTLIGGLGYAAYLATTREVPQAGGRMVEGLVVDGPLSLLPPFAAETQNSRDLSSLLYRGLTRPGPDGRPGADLATRWEIDPQARVYTFHLAAGLRWSDGQPLTSADALFTLALLQGDQLSGSLAGQAWANITAVAPDPATVVYTLPAPSAPFLGQTSLGLVPAHALNRRAPETLRAATDAPTSGPFMVGGVERDRLHLDRNPHAALRPLLDGIDYRLFGSEDGAIAALVAGDIDMVASILPKDAARLAGRANRGVLRSGSFAYAQVLLNQAQGALADAQVRRALAAAVDRQAIVRDDLGGYARLDSSPIPPTITWASAKTPGPAHNLAAAANALDASGWKLPAGGRVRQKDGVPLSLHLAAPDSDPYPAVAQSVARDLARAGIAVKVDVYPQVRLLSDVLAGRKFDMALTPIDNGPDPDVYIFWHSAVAGAPSYNFSGMARDVFLDKDLEDGRFNPDMKARADAYADAQKILAANQPAVFLYCPDVIIGVNQRLRGVTLPAGMEPGGRYASVTGWYVQTRRVKR